MLDIAGMSGFGLSGTIPATFSNLLLLTYDADARMSNQWMSLSWR